MLLRLTSPQEWNLSLTELLRLGPFEGCPVGILRNRLALKVRSSKAILTILVKRIVEHFEALGLASRLR